MRRNVLSTALLVGLLVSIATATYAFNPQPEPPASDPAGVAFGQTARVQVANVVNLMQPMFAAPEAGALGAARAGEEEMLTCAVRLSIVDAEGEMIIVVDSRVGPGQTVGAEVSARELGLTPGERAAVRGVVEFTGDADERVRCQGTTRSSLELYDSRSGRTSLVLPITTTFHPPEPV